MKIKRIIYQNACLILILITFAFLVVKIQDDRYFNDTTFDFILK